MPNILPKLPFERIIKKVGGKRVSQEALEEMANILEEKISIVAKEASELAKHAGRKTLIAEDVRLVRRKA